MVFPGNAMWHERIRLARVFHRLTQNEVADLLGTSRRTVGRIESGALEPSPYVQTRLAKVLNEPEETLFKDLPTRKREREREKRLRRRETCKSTLPLSEIQANMP